MYDTDYSKNTGNAEDTGKALDTENVKDTGKAVDTKNAKETEKAENMENIENPEKREKLEKTIGYTFKDKSLLTLALTLASASETNNQKLECFGDSILEFVATEKLYRECRDEKEMTVRRKVAVCDESLTAISRKLELDVLLIRGKGDVNNKKAVPSAYECLIAAIYLDGGFDEAKKFILSTLDFNAKTEPSVDYKSKLQELLQNHGIPLPVYRHTDVGNAQRHSFVAEVVVGRQVFTGEGDSVKAAEKEAARIALERLGDEL